ncbi:MAG: AMP-binding protein [Desulfobacterales bacterium]|nr:AMP-binding protein [Desulfobacterales bacterium]
MPLHQHFINIAKKYGKKPAIIDRSTNKTFTYSQALIASLILSKKFDHFEQGFIGILLPTSGGAALSNLGLLMSRRVPVMINYSTGAADNVRYAQQKCDFRTVITSKVLLEKINCEFVDGMVFIEDLLQEITLFDKIKAALKSKLPVGTILKRVHGGDDDDQAVMLFTSGSEKAPKAVPLTHRNILSNIEGFSSRFNINDQDCILATLPYFHVFGLTTNMWTPLFHGMTLVSYANPIEFKNVCRVIREEKPSIVFGTPVFFRGYLAKSEQGDYDSARIVVCGADKCPDSLRKGFLEKHNVTLLEGYGVTETSPVIAVNSHVHNRPGSVGHPLPNVEVRILNIDTNEPCKPGEEGRVTVRGGLVMKGYYEDPEETEKSFINGWYDTGDIGYLDEDGYLWLSGRLKRFLKVAGEMVSLVRVEQVLDKLLPDDADCCAVEVPDEAKGAKIVVAVTVPIDEKDILQKMGAELPNIYLPKKFKVIDEMPKMGSGKVDFRTTSKIVLDMLKNKD